MAKPRRKKPGGSIGVLFWIAFILLIVVIYLYNRPTIERTLENTGLVDVLRERFGREPRDTPPQVVTREPEDPVIDLEPADPEPITPRRTSEPQPAPPATAPAVQPEPPQPTQPTPGPARTPEPTAPSVATTTPEPAPAQPVTRTRESTIYYIRVTDDGRIFPQNVTRTVSYTNNPMTQTLHALLAGPTATELSAGLLNLVPENTRLISAAVRDGTAYLNFNESFRFNPMGVEGFVAQLQQVVFSTTEFSTIQRVQFLIEGETVNYLGGDGVYIGAPLDRNSFSDR
ncbi:MAG: hypothetical protein EA403_09645 [Spirochaetaceae bacterium]|nr:MAG: hypothetical protein EA403_09645 [Spirochaetaceae bacterium]